MWKILLLIYLIVTLNANIFSAEKPNPIDEQIKLIQTELNRIEEVTKSSVCSGGINEILSNKKTEYQRRIEFLNKTKTKRNESININRTNIKASYVTNDYVLKKGEMYCYPNPAVSRNPKLHIEAGYAEKVEVEIYDITGRLKDKLTIKGSPVLIGNEYAYEFEWKTEGLGSGTYIMEVKANRGSEKITGRIKCAIIK
ncbi:MAG TPA: T9SS type A sorting domain-containing protein [Elusimicrobiales bacterium]|nr:T9SS type A sorting domain-containing protein [Elusimicrobiales bacterium]HPO95683.1 T9SS type A sorting domain-containing protein [Elusimicrobiales bacterium]